MPPSRSKNLATQESKSARGQPGLAARIVHLAIGRFARLHIRRAAIAKDRDRAGPPCKERLRNGLTVKGKPRTAPSPSLSTFGAPTAPSGRSRAIRLATLVALCRDCRLVVCDRFRRWASFSLLWASAARSACRPAPRTTQTGDIVMVYETLCDRFNLYSNYATNLYFKLSK